MRNVRIDDRNIDKLVCKVTGRLFPAPQRVFHVGETYTTLEGKQVKIIVEKRDYKGAYDTIQGDDGAWRYDRKDDRGRCTGASDDYPRNLIPPEGSIP